MVEKGPSSWSAARFTPEVSSLCAQTPKPHSPSCSRSEPCLADQSRRGTRHCNGGTFGQAGRREREKKTRKRTKRERERERENKQAKKEGRKDVRKEGRKAGRKEKKGHKQKEWKGQELRKQLRKEETITDIIKEKN